MSTELQQVRTIVGSWWSPNVQQRCLSILAESIDVAHSVSTECWALTFTEKRSQLRLRLNVGQVEVLTMRARDVRFLVARPLEVPRPSKFVLRGASLHGEPSGIYYRAVPVPSMVCEGPCASIATLPQQVLDAHHKFIREAAARKRGSPFRRFHSPAALDYVEQMLGKNIARPSWASQDFRLPDEVSSGPFFEGARTRIEVNRYERDSAARARCIGHYGAKCAACDLEMHTRYGEIARGLIHVHHLRPLSEIGDEYEVDPIDDLRPVCPNCHAVLHYDRETPIGIEALRQLLSALNNVRS